jgi:ATP-dependent Clp protease protease subunit
MELQHSSPSLTLDDEITRRMLVQRRVMLTGPIDSKLAERVCAQLLVLDAEHPGKTVTLYVNSPGGEVDAGFAIYDTMQTMESDVATVCMGFAASMAQFLLVGGAPGKRAAYAHSRILMHQPLGQVGGSAIDIKIQAEQFAIARRMIAELTAKHCGQDVEQVMEDGDRDRWFTPDEARGYGSIGMIDEIIPAR